MHGGQWKLRTREELLPVGERPDEGVGNQLYGGLGGKQQSHFDILADQHAAGLGAVAVVLRQPRGHGGRGGRLSGPGRDVRAQRLDAVVV